VHSCLKFKEIKQKQQCREKRNLYEVIVLLYLNFNQFKTRTVTHCPTIDIVRPRHLLSTFGAYFWRIRSQHEDAMSCVRIRYRLVATSLARV
jgi:hypothetical protein